MVPEILNLILNLLDLADLARCLRVSHLWHTVGVRRLWRGSARASPPLRYMYALCADPARLQHYVQHVRCLVIERSDAAILSKSQFAHQGKLWNPLRPGLVKIDGLFTSPLPLPLYKPGLRVLDYTAVALSQAEVSMLVSMLKKACPELEYLRLVARQQNTTVRAKHDLSVDLKNIKVFKYNFSFTGYSAVLIGTLTAELFSHDKLQYLKLAGKQLPDELPPITFVHPLRYLSITLSDTSPLEKLLLRLHNLESLKIEFQNPRENECRDIRKNIFIPIKDTCLKLQHLKLINIHRDLNFDEGCIDMLAKANIGFKSLSIIRVCDRPGIVSASVVTSFAVANPSLLVLELGAKFEVSAETIVVIGQYCPHIRHIAIDSSIDLVRICDYLESRPDSLTKLQYLYANQWLYDGRPRLNSRNESRGRELAFATRCQKCMPSLRQLSSKRANDNYYENFGDVQSARFNINRFLQTGSFDKDNEKGRFYTSEDHSLDIQQDFAEELDRCILSSAI